MGRRIVLIVLFLLLVTIPVTAQSAIEDGADYDALLEDSGANDLAQSLPKETRDLLNQLGLSDIDADSLIGLTPESILNTGLQALLSSAGAPIKAGAAIIGVILLCALLGGFRSTMGERPLTGVFSVVSTLAICTVILAPLVGVIERAGAAIQSGAAFMLSFIPVFAGILMTSGQAVSAGVYQVLLLGLAELLNWGASTFLVPLMTIFLAFSIVASLAPDLNLTSLANTLHKTASWVLGILMTVFVGLMTVQGVVGSSADSVTLKTAKFVAGSFIPVVGSAVGDALGSVYTCLKLLKSTVGAFGIFAVILIFLPALLETLVWQLALNLTAAVGDVFGLGQLTAVIRAAAKVLALLSAVMICCALVIVVSTAIMMMLGGTV